MNNNFYDLKAKEFFENTVNVDMSPHYKEFLKLIPENNLILIKGAIPGAKNSIVYIREAVKK